MFPLLAPVFFAHQPVSSWDHRRWGHVDQVRSVGDLSSCKRFCSVPGPLQSVQRAEMCGVILALQSSGAVHLGVGNLSVVRHVGRLLDGRHGPTPFELVKVVTFYFVLFGFGFVYFVGIWLCGLSKFVGFIVFLVWLGMGVLAWSYSSSFS